MPVLLRLLAPALLLASGLLAQSGPGSSCVALVVGNSNYVNPPIRPLRNTLNDAQQIAERLRKEGKCEVFEAADLRSGQVRAILDRFLARIRPGVTVYFYFSGHGVQVEEQNLLINVDAEVNQVNVQSIRFQDFLRDIRARNPRVTVSIIDACRERLDIPDYAASAKGIFVGMALQQAEPNSVLIYATARGRVASGTSKDGNLSLFTAAFLRHFHSGVDLYSAFMQSKEQVLAESGGAQEPWLDFQVSERICLGGRCGVQQREVTQQELKPRVQCADATPFPYVERGQWGYLACDGTVRIAARYESAWPFSQSSPGLAAVRVNGKYGYVDASGRMRIQPQFDEAYEFDKGGIAAVRKGSEAYFIGLGGSPVTPVYRGARSFAAGLAPVAQLVDGHLRWGYIGTRREKPGAPDRVMMIPPQFEDAMPFGANGWAAVKQNGLWGFINKSGAVVLPPRFAHAPSPRAMEIMIFHDGLCPAFDGRQWGFINERGEWAIPPAFTRVKHFRNGLAAVQIRLGGAALKWGYLEPSGEFRIPPSYDNAYDFHGDVAIVRQGGAGGPHHRLVAINRSGVFLLPPE